MNKLADKIKNKKPVTIAFFGDSVTQGCFELRVAGEGCFLAGGILISGPWARTVRQPLTATVASKGSKRSHFVFICVRFPCLVLIRPCAQANGWFVFSVLFWIVWNPFPHRPWLLLWPRRG